MMRHARAAGPFAATLAGTFALCGVEAGPAPATNDLVDAVEAVASAPLRLSDDDVDPSTRYAPLQQPGTQNEFAIAPIPFSSPTLGLGLAVGMAYLHRWPGQTAETPQSVIGLGGFGSDNGSWGAAGGQQMVLANDDLRLSWGVAIGQINLDFYGIGDEAGEDGRKVPFEQEFAALTMQGLGRVAGDLYTGLRVVAGITDIRPGKEMREQYPILEGVNVELWQVGVGVPLQFDSRDNRFWPTSGGFGELAGTIYDSAFGSDVEYESLSASWNHFFGWSGGQVLGLRFAARWAGDGAPFYALPMYGSQSDLRGYPAGRYRDHLLVATQAEYRWRFHRRWVAAVFAGVGDVAPEIEDVGENGVLPAAGAGIRWLVAPDSGLGLRLDVATGIDETVWYLSLGEAF